MAFLKSFSIALFAMIAPILALATPTAWGQGVDREYALKAAFLYNFCRFIDWPENAFPSHHSPIVIGVLGADPFGSRLAETVEGEVVRGRPIRVERYSRPEQARNCQILFVSKSEVSRVPAILASVRGRSIVTVGETSNFIDYGGMIALTTERNRIRLQINPDHVREARVIMSSKLLRVADIQH